MDSARLELVHVPSIQIYIFIAELHTQGQSLPKALLDEVVMGSDVDRVNESQRVQKMATKKDRRKEEQRRKEVVKGEEKRPG